MAMVLSPSVAPSWPATMTMRTKASWIVMVFMVCPMCALVGADAGFDACCVPYLEFADVFLLICVVLLPYNAISRLCLSRPEWETHIVFGRALCGSFCASADARTAVPFVV